MKKFLTDNIGLKIMSIFLAALVWLAIMNVADPIITASISSIPVKVINDDVIKSRGYQYRIESGEEVSIKVKGKRSVVDKLTKESFEARADFYALSKMYMTNIEVKCIAPDIDENDIEITQKNDTMAIKLEDEETRPFSVRIAQSGAVKDGYYCYEMKASTTLVQVTGSVSQVSEVKEVVAYVDLEGKSNSFTSDCMLIAYDMDGNEIDSKKLSFSQDMIEVSIGLWPTKTVKVAARTQGTPAVGYYNDDIQFAPEEVTIAADISTLNRIETLWVNCDTTGAVGDVEMQVNISDYLNEKYGPSVIPTDETISIGVIAAVKPMDEKKLTIDNNAIEIRGLAEGLKAAVFTAGTSSVLLIGRKADIENVNVQDLKFYIDLSSCEEGTHFVPLMSDYRGDFSIESGTVAVTVSKADENETL